MRLSTFSFTAFIACLALGCLLAKPIKAEAHPVAYAGAFSIMGWSQGKNTMIESYYSVTHRFSAGAEFERRSGDAGKSSMLIGRANFLLWRLNFPDAQFNQYVSAGYGSAFDSSDQHPTFKFSTQVDGEDRRFYAAAKYDFIKTHGMNDEHTVWVRLGAAPYVSEFNEPAAWFILQGDMADFKTESFDVTPLIRIFYKSALIEAGVSFEGRPLFTYMVHF